MASAPLTVSCDNIIGSSRWASVSDGYRVVLGGSVSAPRSYFRKPAVLKGPRWLRWIKAGLVVHAGRGPVTVTLPNAWRGRAAITWGNGLPAVNTLQIATCDPAPNAWNGYAGGILIRSRSACVPLTFRIGTHSKTLRFGIGRHCGAP